MNGAFSAAALSEIVGSIYDCAIDPSGWLTVLDRLRRELNFHNAILSVVNMKQGRVLLNINSGVPDAWRKALPHYQSDIGMIWGGDDKLQSYALNEPHLLTLVNPQGLTEKSRFYSEWVKPQGLIDALLIGLANEQGTIGAIALGRHESGGSITRNEVENARLLLPHLQRAVTISRLLDVKAVTAATFASVIDALTTAVVLVGAEMNVVHANAVARAMLGERSLIRIQSGRFAVGSTGADRALAAAVAQAATAESKIARKGFEVPVRSGNGSGHVLHVLPIRPGTLRAGVMPSAVAAVFIASRSSPRATPNGALAALFGLTPMESRVLELMASGSTNAAIAKSLGIAVSTVRTHLLHLFDKTGVRRQAELVALATSFELPLQG
jgi:DNA-binding CsgD family transcriptional regulator